MEPQTLNVVTNCVIGFLTIVGTVISIILLVGKRFDKIDAQLLRHDVKFDEIHKDLRNIDSRLSKLEGVLLGRGDGTYDG